MNRILQSLSIKAKLLTITVGFSIAICTLVYFFVTVRNESIEFARKEQRGVVLSQSLNSILNEACKASTDAIHSDKAVLENSVRELKKLADEANDCGVSDKITGVCNQATALAQSYDAQSRKNAAKQLRSSTRECIATVTDNSNLTLDPDLDSYYIMDCASVRMADASLMKATICEQLDALAAEPTSSSAREDLDLSVARLADIVGVAEADMQTAIAKNQDGSLRNALEAASASTISTVSGLKSIRKLTTLAAADIPPNAKQYYAMIDKAFASNASFVQLAFKQLDTLLAARAHHYVIDRWRNIAIAFVLMLVPLVITYMIARIVLKSVGSLQEAVSAVQQGNLNTHIELESTDELGDLASGFNNMLATIRDGNEKSQKEQKKSAQLAEQAEVLQQQSEEYSAYLKESISALLGTMRSFSDGDLTVEVHSDNNDMVQELFEGFNTSVTRLRSIVEQVREAVEATSSASSQISSSTEEMAAGAQEQTNQTNDVATAVEEMTKTILENSMNTRETAQAAEKARLAAESGGQVINESVQGMERIARVVNNSANTIRTLGASSAEIGAIINVINDIADQTNLLALNAAIEAARAGEQGRGFAVVADEVRKLAERTSKATQEISVMIKKIQSETDGAVAAIEEGTKEVEQGIALSQRAGVSLNEIVADINTVSSMISQIAVATEQQSSTSEQISRNIEVITTVTAETATGITQIARAAELLNQLTENLQTIVGQFRLTQEEATHAATAVHHARRFEDRAADHGGRTHAEFRRSIIGGKH